MPRPKSSPPLVILNIPELGDDPPEWEEVQGVFRGAQGHVMVQAMMRMLAAAMAEARSVKEVNPGPALPADQGKYWDGRASTADEVLLALLQMVRGEGKRVSKRVAGLFGSGKEEP